MIEKTYRIGNDKYRGVLINDTPDIFSWLLNDIMNEQPSSNIKIKDVMYNPPATIVWFIDGDKVVSKCDKVDSFSKEVGFMTCLLKKYLGKKKFYKLMDRYVYSKEND